MAGSPDQPHFITYYFEPNETVWVIRDCNGSPKLEGATVIRVRAEVLVTATTVAYDVQLDSASAGTVEVAAADIFNVLDDAIVEYRARLEAL